MSQSGRSDAGGDDSSSVPEESADLYACLGVGRDATQAEIATAYRRLSRVVHPDKRVVAGAGNSADASDASYQRIRRAYDILRDPDSRRVYDEFGSEGLRALHDGAVALRGRGALEIREELAKLRRLRQEAALMQLTQPFTRLTIGVHACSLFSTTAPPDQDAGEENAKRQKRRGAQQTVIYLHNLGLSQNTCFVLTPKHRLVLAGSLSRVGRSYVPSVLVTLRSQLSDRMSSDLTFGLNYMPTVAGKLSYRLNPNLLTSVRAEVNTLQDGRVLASLTPSISCQISPSCLGTLSYTWNSPSKGANAEVVYQLSAGLHGKAVVFMTHDNAGVQLSCSRELGDLRLGAGVSLDLNDLWSLRYSLAQKVSEYSEAAMSVKFGPAVGVRLKLTLARGNQLYSMPITLSEWVDPVAIVYGTAVPVIVYVILYKCLYAPWLVKFQRDARTQRSDAEAQHRSARRAEALAAQSLMRQTAANSRDAERSKGGLVIDRAVYGCLSTTGDQPIGDDSELVIEVTDCLQILVDNSRLEIPASLTKADLPGFCDPCDGGGDAGADGDGRSELGRQLQQRHLLIRYSFAGAPHSVMVADTDAVRLPQRRHAVDVAA